MNIRTGIRKLTLLFVGLFIALSAGLVYWQVVVGDQVAANIHNGRPCLYSNAPQRGRIRDRNGVVLAESITKASCGNIRHYTDPSLAGLIGYYAGINYPATGLESQFDDILSGRAGLTAMSNVVNRTLHRPPVGDDIYLTIDERIQQSVAKHFDDPINIIPGETFRTDRGSVVVSDPHTGEILAMLSRPSYDPNKLVQTLMKGELSYYNSLAQNPHQPLVERPIQALYSPGSTFKTVTLLAGLDSGKTTLNEQFDRDHARGPVTLGTGDETEMFGPNGNNIDGYTMRFPITTEYGFVHSDNIIFAQIGARTGVDTWLDYTNRFFVGQQVKIDGLPVVVSKVQDTNKQGEVQRLKVNRLAENAFGQGADSISAFQMSLIDNVVANDGQLMQPALISKVVDPASKSTIQSFSSKTLGSQQVSQQTAISARKAMYGVVRCGSGSIVSQLFGSQWSIIGKTGTAEVGGGLPAHSWMITQAPYSVESSGQLPAVTIVAMKENGGEGGATVGPMIAAIYNDIFSNNYVKPQIPPANDTRTYCCSTGMLQIGC
ncbi:MAG: penicillin-binding protein 2 [Chloroflexi bacterium]|nr:MAG: penicillin-binding protein 2 [Chloroflexota bacterium]